MNTLNCCIRAFTEQDVSNEDIRKIVDAARYAPSGMNYQPWEFIVVKDKEAIEVLTTMKMPKFMMRLMKKTMRKKRKMPEDGLKQAQNAGTMIIAVGDTRKQISLPGQRYSYKNNKITLKNVQR